jgi:hypothetical protein
MRYTDGMPTVEEIKSKFDELKEKWHNETCFSSSMTDIFANQHHLEIIKMGPVVLPLIVNCIAKHLYKKSEGAHFWYDAIRQISGENPCEHMLEKDAGRIRIMDLHCLIWAERNGYVPTST